MTSLRFPDTGTRMVLYASGRPAAGLVGELFADRPCTTIAEVYADNAGVKGALIADAKITLDQYGQQPDYWGPVAGTDRLYLRVNGVVSPVDADYNARIDADEMAAPLAHAASHASAGSDPLTVTQAQVTGLTAALAAKVGEGELVFNARDFGLLGDGSDETSALNAALTAAAGATLLIPAGTYNFTTITMSGANTHLQLASGCTLNKTTATTNGLQVSGANCTVSGPGRILCPSTWDGTNTTWTYAVVYVTGHGCSIRNVALDNVPKVGIGLRDVNNTQVHGCRITGNYPSGQWTGIETCHFAIAVDSSAAAPKGNLSVTGNIIRSCVQGVDGGNFGSASIPLGYNITGNVFENCWNHGVYASDGDGHVIVANTFSRCQIPVAVTGNDHNISGNTMVTDGTGNQNDIQGISVRDAQRCVVRGNIIYGDSLPAGSVISVDALTNGVALKDNVVEGNTIVCTTGTSTAIRVGGTTLASEVSGNIIRNNVVKVPGRTSGGLISVSAPAAARGRHNRVEGNTVTVTNDTWGVQLVNQDLCQVENNTIRWEWDAPGATTTYGIYLQDSLDCVVRNNRQVVTALWGANLTVRGIADVGAADYNRLIGNQFDYDLTKLAAATALYATGTNTTRLDNRLSRTDVVDDNRYVPKVASGITLPSDFGFTAWSQPISISSTNTALPTAGTVYIARALRWPAATVTNLHVYVAVAGSSLTSGQCFAALYKADGTLVGVTADQAAAWAGTGPKTMALQGGPFSIAAGDYYLAVWFNGTTGPSLARTATAVSGFVNLGRSSPNLKAASANTGVTTTAPSPLGTPQTIQPYEWWFAIS